MDTICYTCDYTLEPIDANICPICGKEIKNESDYHSGLDDYETNATYPETDYEDHGYGDNRSYGDDYEDYR